jgi:hypothetical protein
MNAVEILQAIYDSEINFKICSPCWDGGFTVSIMPDGPYDGTWLVNADGSRSIEEAVKVLVRLVLEHYPNSKFAVEWLEGRKGR